MCVCVCVCVCVCDSRAARQALKRGEFEEAAALAERAMTSFLRAGSKGYKRAQTEAKGSKNLVARAQASSVKVPYFIMTQHQRALRKRCTEAKVLC